MINNGGFEKGMPCNYTIWSNDAPTINFGANVSTLIGNATVEM
jgi:hypothetical protein